MIAMDAAAMDDQPTMRTARAAYYRDNDFGDDGGDALTWVPIKLWKLTLKIPNSDGRRRAVRIHDLHHVVTGYATDLRGEAEIGAWELASGCLRWPAATVLNSFALAIGTALSPCPSRCASCSRAIQRGRAGSADSSFARSARGSGAWRASAESARR
jgi:hypothetical protein